MILSECIVEHDSSRRTVYVETTLTSRECRFRLDAPSSMDAISLLFTNVSSSSSAHRHSSRINRECQPRISISQPLQDGSLVEFGKICLDLIDERVPLEKCMVSRASNVIVSFRWGRRHQAAFTLRYSYFHKGKSTTSIPSIFFSTLVPNLLIYFRLERYWLHSSASSRRDRGERRLCGNSRRCQLE